MSVMLAGLPRRVAVELTRRSLWGHLPRKRQDRPAGPPLLALSFDLDYQADTDALPALMRMVDDHSATMTLFSIGKLVEQDAGAYREAAQQGHEIANHTLTHPDNPVLNPDNEFWHLSVDDMYAEISGCQDMLQALTGCRPSSFRTPHFKDALRMLEALERVPEITAVSTALASKCPIPTPYYPAHTPVADDLSLHFATQDASVAAASPLMVPLTPCPGMRWSPFCSYSAIREPRNPRRGAGLLDVPEWERRWQTMLQRAHPRGFASVYFDPLDVMRDEHTRAGFDRMLTHATESGWLITTINHIEQQWRPIAPPLRAASSAVHQNAGVYGTPE